MKLKVTVTIDENVIKRIDKLQNRLKFYEKYARSRSSLIEHLILKGLENEEKYLKMRETRKEFKEKQKDEYFKRLLFRDIEKELR